MRNLGKKPEDPYKALTDKHAMKIYMGSCNVVCWDITTIMRRLVKMVKMKSRRQKIKAIKR